MPPRLRPPGQQQTWVAAAFFAGLTVLLCYPLSIHPGSTSLGSDPDVHTFTWTLAWDAHALFHAPWSVFDANIFFPYNRTLAFSENMIGSAIVAAPALWLTGNPVLALNAVSLVSVMLCGLGAYVLGRRLGIGVAGALICGVIFAFSPARFFRFAQTHLTTIQWIPFALAWLHSYLESGARRDLLIAIAFFTLQALTSGHGAVYLVIAVALLVLLRIISRSAPPIVKILRDAGLPGVLLLLPALLIIPPYFAVQRELGLHRSLENWAPAAQSFLASPTSLHAWILSKVSSSDVNHTASAFMFPGYLPLLLAGAAFLPGSSSPLRRHVVFFAMLTVLAVLLSAGPPLGLWPYVYWIPGFNFIRIPSRFIVLAVLGLAVLAGIAFDRLSRRAFPNNQVAAAVIVGLLLVVEFWTVPLPVTPYRVDIPPIDRWLDTQPKPFAIAEVPVKPFVRYHSTYMLHSMAHWQRTVHGHSSLLTPLHEKLYDELRTFPDDVSLGQLSEIGVNYVVVHEDMYEPGEWPAVEARLRQYSGWLTLRHEERGGRVYELRRPR